MPNLSENLDLINLWKSQENKLDKMLVLNELLLKKQLKSEADASLNGLKIIRYVGIIFGVLWCTAMTIILLNGWHESNWFFKSAFIIHIGITLAAIGLYIHHLVLLHEVDKSQDVLHAQKQLIRLRHSNLRTLGLLWLQLPVFSLWYMNDEWMHHSPQTFWYIQLPLVLVQLGIGIWLYLNLHHKNADKKWFKWFMSRGEFKQIEQANLLLSEIKALES